MCQWFIRHRLLSDDVNAWQASDMFTFVDKPTRKRSRQQASFESIIRCSSNGRPTDDRDISRSRRWALLSARGFYTHSHTDAGGFCTWTMLTCGGKVWGYVYPKGHFDPTNCRQASAAYIHLTDAADYLNGTPEVDLQQCAIVRNIILAPGTLLCVSMPYRYCTPPKPVPTRTEFNLQGLFTPYTLLRIR